MLQNEIGDVEQNLARRAIAHPGLGESTDAVEEWEARAQQGHAEALGGGHRM